jgi:hypothetical protein
MSGCGGGVGVWSGEPLDVVEAVNGGTVGFDQLLVGEDDFAQTGLTLQKAPPSQLLACHRLRR